MSLIPRHKGTRKEIKGSRWREEVSKSRKKFFVA
jgi:hypothetical protein